MADPISFNSVILPLSAALGISLVVERILEFFKNFMEPLIGTRETRKIPELSETDEKIKDLERLHKENNAVLKAEKEAKDLKDQLEKESDPLKKKEIKDKLVELEKEGEWEESFPNNTVLVVDATDPDDGTTLRAFVIQLLGFALGILLARMANVQLFNAFLGKLNAIPQWFDYVLTGLLIGGGSAPIHVLIRFISERKVPVEAKAPYEEKKAAPKKKEKPIAPAVISAASDAAVEDWIDIPYDGGIDCDILEDVHKREKDPDMVVYHHTAMNSKSTFDDVIRIIKDKKWLTGYNCVIMADGSICPFCRWDRYGNHAVGYNQRSLGIAFNGNFETDLKVPFSNPDGRYGHSSPTEAQLKAGARVLTLWSLLYKFDIDFAKTIIPHNKISSKSCPGSSFPKDELIKWTEFYRAKWEKSDVIKGRIEAFNLKPYLFVKEK